MVRQHRLGPAHRDQHGARVPALLDDPGEELALGALERAEHLLVLDVPQPLDDHLARGRRRDPTEALGGVVELLGQLGLAALRRRSGLRVVLRVVRRATLRSSLLHSAGAFSAPAPRP